MYSEELSFSLKPSRTAMGFSFADAAIRADDQAVLDVGDAEGEVDGLALDLVGVAGIQHSGKVINWAEWEAARWLGSGFW